MHLQIGDFVTHQFSSQKSKLYNCALKPIKFLPKIKATFLNRSVYAKNEHLENGSRESNVFLVNGCHMAVRNDKWNSAILLA